MRVALVLPGSIWYAPYVRIYTGILDELSVDYSIISWNRDGQDALEGFQYQARNQRGHGSASLKEYRGYIKFIKKTINEQSFDRLIVFGPQMTCLLSIYLFFHFRGRYMIDYRDLSIEQKRGFKQLFSFMLRFSSFNVVSSPGFKKYLPKREYLLSHNFDKEIVSEALAQECNGSFGLNKGIDVLTIGAIRDYDSNLEVIQSLANHPGISLRFIGRGDTAIVLENYCKENGIYNVYFKGYYPKEEEPHIIADSDFLNIYYPRKISHDTALSNRFYNSLIYKKPMIVTKDTIQGDYAEKYNVGVAVKDCTGLEDRLKSFLDNDFCEYANRCNKLLESFLEEQTVFEKAVKGFVTNCFLD